MEASKMISSQDHSIEKFISIINTAPKKADVKINTQANNSKYLPISMVEMELDELFFGLWQTKGFESSVIVNEIVGQIELGVFHPIAKTWLWRTGAAAVMIQQKRGSDITDVGAKHKNTLVKDYAHLKTECIKNAAKSLGKAFGRDLNRKDSGDYLPMSTQMKIISFNEEAVKEEIRKATTKAQLTKIYNANKSMSGISELITTRRKSL